MPHRRIERALRWLLRAVGAAAFVWVLRAANLRGAVPAIAKAGPILALGLVPFLVQIALDARAWRILLAGLGHRVAWRRLIAVRLATEAVLLTVPGGSLVGESLKPYLLHRAAAVPIADSVASVTIKRCVLALALAAYLALAWWVGDAWYAAASRRVVGGTELAAYVASAAALVAAIGTIGLLVASSAAVAERAGRLLARLPSRRLRAALERRRAGLAATDAALAALRRPAPLARAFALLLAAWLTEAVETFVLLRLLGVALAPTQVLAMEAAVVFARNAAFFVPAGLGVQDAGYLAFLAAFGVGSPLAAAFVVVKRSKELVWIAVGYLVLLVLGQRPAARVAGGAIWVATEGSW